jgi:hypothetical protein
MSWRRLVIGGLIALWVLTLAVIGKTSIDRLLFPPPWGNPRGDGLSAEVAGDTHVGQQFAAPLPGLYRIEIVLARATARNAHPVTFHLKTDPASAQDIWVADLNTSDVQDNRPYGFEFEPIRDSKGKSYYFYLESAASAPGDAIAVHYSPYATLEGASAYLGGQPVAGDLQFHTFYSLRTRDRIDLLLTQMAEGRPYIFGTKGFYVGMAVAYALVLGVFLLLIARVILEEAEGER